MLHTETVLASTLDLLKAVQRLPDVSAMLVPATWEMIKEKIESAVREFVRDM